MLHKGFLAMLHETDSHVQMKPKSASASRGQRMFKPSRARWRQHFLSIVRGRGVTPVAPPVFSILSE
jgi:hypothetical protein